MGLPGGEGEERPSKRRASFTRGEKRPSVLKRREKTFGEGDGVEKNQPQNGKSKTPIKTARRFTGKEALSPWADPEKTENLCKTPIWGGKDSEQIRGGHRL